MFSYEFIYGKHFKTSAKVINKFNEHGFIILRNLFSGDEVSKLIAFFETSKDIEENCYRRDDGRDLQTMVCLWNVAGDDIGGMVSRSRRVVDTMEELLGG
jgi:hypothetical protein